MINELDELYRQVILDHNKNPRNFGDLDPHTHDAKGHNPLCGDRIELFLDVHDGVIKDIKFKADGCAISKASASIMTTVLKGKTVEEADKLFDEFRLLVPEDSEEEPDTDKLGKLAVFSGVREFPTRVKCASLSWHTLKTALADKEQVVTTE